MHMFSATSFAKRHSCFQLWSGSGLCAGSRGIQASNSTQSWGLWALVSALGLCVFLGDHQPVA